MNLGQSVFQDTYLVAQAQLTPYRQLRQLELELRSIDDSLKRASINQRRTLIKIAKLDKDNVEEALDIEEFEWDLFQQEQMIQDALARKANFEHLKEQLLKNVPQEYWQRGYEAAEPEHWVLHFAKKIALENLTQGRPSMHTIEQVILLPKELQMQISLKGQQEFLALGGQQPQQAIEAEIKDEPSRISSNVPV